MAEIFTAPTIIFLCTTSSVSLDVYNTLHVFIVTKV